MKNLKHDVLTEFASMQGMVSDDNLEQYEVEMSTVVLDLHEEAVILSTMDDGGEFDQIVERILELE